MSIDPNPMASGTADFQPAQNGGSRFWLVFGLGCGSLLLLCCGGGVIATILVVKNAMQITKDPAEIQRQAGQIAHFDVPDGFEPDTALTISVPFSGQTLMNMVSFAPPDKDGVVSLIGVGAIAANADRDQIRRDVEQRMNQQGIGTKPLDTIESRDFDLEINGKPATFRIQKARDPQAKREYVQFDGVFEGKQGPAVLIGQIKVENFSEEDAESLLRSIR